MNRITIGLYDDIYQQLEKNAREKGVGVSQYARYLIELALRLEDAGKNKAGKEEPDNGSIAALGEVKTLWRNELIWTLETRNLMRYLVDKLSPDGKETTENMREMAKEKAEAFVKGLLQENE